MQPFRHFFEAVATVEFLQGGNDGLTFGLRAGVLDGFPKRAIWNINCRFHASKILLPGILKLFQEPHAVVAEAADVVDAVKGSSTTDEHGWTQLGKKDLSQRRGEVVSLERRRISPEKSRRTWPLSASKTPSPPKRTGGPLGRLTAFEGSGTVSAMQSLPPSCPPLPDLPPLFWTEVAKQVAYWQEFFAQAAPGDAPPDEMRKICITRIKTRLKHIYAGKNNAGRSLFEMAHYVACLTVIDSRN